MVGSLHSSTCCTLDLQLARRGAPWTPGFISVLKILNFKVSENKNYF
jgi:hypothetical protein